MIMEQPPLQVIPEYPPTPSFNTPTVYCCPRFYKGSIVADGRAPMTKFKNRIYANNCKQIIQ